MDLDFVDVFIESTNLTTKIPCWLLFYRHFSIVDVLTFEVDEINWVYLQVILRIKRVQNLVQTLVVFDFLAILVSQGYDVDTILGKGDVVLAALNEKSSDTALPQVISFIPV